MMTAATPSPSGKPGELHQPAGHEVALDLASSLPTINTGCASHHPRGLSPL